MSKQVTVDSIVKRMKKCPCYSNQDFSVCCEPYLIGKGSADTPEKLMRSRYCAYALVNMDYIQQTMCKNAIEHYDPVSAKQWASSVTWLGLTVIAMPTPSGQFGTVTFFARFLDNAVKRYIYEKSQFEKIDGKWLYIDGVTFKITLANGH